MPDLWYLNVLKGGSPVKSGSGLGVEAGAGLRQQNFAPDSEDPRTLSARVHPEAAHPRRRAQAQPRHRAQGGILGYPPPRCAMDPASD